jgi:hypothetical protein
MDFISGLPNVDGFDYSATFVDSFIKQALFIPCSIHINAPQLARLFLGNIHRHHGLDRTIISDRDPKLTSTFWQIFFIPMQIKLKFLAHTTHKSMASLNIHTSQSNKYFVHLLNKNITIV